MTQCTFDRAWIGECKKEDCKEHMNLTCCCCKKPATRECSETGGFVCGAPLCETCEHTIAPDGCNSGMLGSARLPDDMKTHCKKGEQRFLPWYAK